MGRMLGSYADDQNLDRPDLNKCPECGCYFELDDCPLCGKPCPEHMRAGNRPTEKKKKRKTVNGSNRVVFIEWYHSWWFIAIMLFFFPLIGIILLATSPHKGWKKGIFITLAILYGIASTVGFGGILSRITGLWDKPVDTSMTREEYVAVCEDISTEELYRTPDRYEDAYVCITLKVVTKAVGVDGQFDLRDVYYLCEDAEGSTYRVILRDCLIEGKENFISGDVITVYGEVDEECDAWDSSYTEWTGPCVNMAYAVVQK